MPHKTSDGHEAGSVRSSSPFEQALLFVAVMFAALTVCWFVYLVFVAAFRMT
jgi:hypothetical protein